MKRMKLMIIAALFAAGAMTAGAASLEEDYAALKTYEFGQDRHALTNIADAAMDTTQHAAIEKALLAVLEDCTDDAARFICRQIQIVGGEASVAALEARAGDPALAGHVIRALEAMPIDAADAAIIRLSKNYDTGVRIAAVEALGRGSVDGALDAAKAALDDTDQAVAIAAAYALSALEACDTLHAAWADGGNEAAAGALLECSTEHNFTDHLIALYESDAAGNIRAGALHGIIEREGDEALPMVIDALTSGDSEVMDAGLAHVHTLPGEQATEAFAALVGEAPPVTRVRLINALADRGDSAAGAAVRAQIDAEEEAVSYAALSALAHIGGAEDLPVLAETAAANTGEQRRLARASLNRVQDPGASETLVKLARSGDTKVRSEAIRALGARRTWEAKGVLLELANDEDAGIRGDVWDALAILGATDDLPRYLDHLAKSLDDARLRDIEQAIAAIAERETDPEKRIKSIADALEDASPEMRGTLYRIVGGIPGDPALALLRDGLADAVAEVRGEAVAALAKRPGDAAKADLLAVAQNPQNDDERADALAGYIRILNETPDRDVALLDEYRTALKLAKDAGERRQILSGVGSVPARKSYSFVNELHGDAELEVERALASIQIANALRGVDPAWAQGIVEPFARHENDTLKSQARTVLHNLKREEGYLTAWEVSGPYTKAGHTGGMLYDVAFPPETGGGMWRVQPLSADPNYPAGGVNLAESIGGFERVAYLRTVVNAPSAMDAILELGTNDGVKVWVNGQFVHGVNTGRPLQPGQDQVPIKLLSGENNIMIAVYQHGGDWGSVTRLVSNGGHPLTGLINHLASVTLPPGEGGVPWFLDCAGNGPNHYVAQFESPVEISSAK